MTDTKTAKDDSTRVYKAPLPVSIPQEKGISIVSVDEVQSLSGISGFYATVRISSIWKDSAVLEGVNRQDYKVTSPKFKTAEEAISSAIRAAAVLRDNIDHDNVQNGYPDAIPQGRIGVDCFNW